MSWTRSQPIVSSFVHSVINDSHDAEDLLQQIAMILVKKYHLYDHDKSFTAWAIGIAKNEILNYQRKKANEKFIFDHEIVSIMAQAYQEDSEELNRFTHALHQCLKKIQGKKRDLLEMFYIQQLKSSQIAQKIGATQNSVFVALHRIRMALRDCINKKVGAVKG